MNNRKLIASLRKLFVRLGRLKHSFRDFKACSETAEWVRRAVIVGGVRTSMRSVGVKERDIIRYIRQYLSRNCGAELTEGEVTILLFIADVTAFSRLWRHLTHPGLNAACIHAHEVEIGGSHIPPENIFYEART